MGLLKTLCEELIEKPSDTKQVDRGQSRYVIANGGIEASLLQDSSPDASGNKVSVRDISKTGLGLLSWNVLNVEASYSLHIPGLSPLRGHIVYGRRESCGQHRYGFCLSDNLSEQDYALLMNK